MLLKMALRNIWRNKRRTLITSASVMFAGFLTITLTSIETGMWENMIQSVVNQSTGHLQIQSPAYYDEPTIDNAFEANDVLLEQLSHHKEVLSINPRIENFLLIAKDDKTKPVYIIGVDPESEKKMTGLNNYLKAGTYLTAEEGSGILIGTGLAHMLNISPGDSLVFFGQGFRGAFSVGILPVQGILDFPLREQNNQMVYLNFADASNLFQSENRFSHLMIQLKNSNRIEAVAGDISKIANNFGLKSYTWKELLPELIEAKEVDEASTLITMYILYLVVSFGVFGTLLMLLNERMYEMGVLVSIGMKRTKLMMMIWLEFLIMALMGLVFAIVLSFIVLSILKANPIPFGDEMQEVFEQYGMEAVLTATVNYSIFVRELITVSLIVTILSIYPLLKIYKLNPITAMRG